MNDTTRPTGRIDPRPTEAEYHGSWRDVYAALECPPPDAGGDGQGGERRL